MTRYMYVLLECIIKWFQSSIMSSLGYTCPYRHKNSQEGRIGIDTQAQAQEWESEECEKCENEKQRDKYD